MEQENIPNLRPIFPNFRILIPCMSSQQAHLSHKFRFSKKHTPSTFNAVRIECNFNVIFFLQGDIYARFCLIKLVAPSTSANLATSFNAGGFFVHLAKPEKSHSRAGGRRFPGTARRKNGKKYRLHFRPSALVKRDPPRWSVEQCCIWE